MAFKLPRVFAFARPVKSLPRARASMEKTRRARYIMKRRFAEEKKKLTAMESATLRYARGVKQRICRARDTALSRELFSDEKYP